MKRFHLPLLSFILVVGACRAGTQSPRQETVTIPESTRTFDLIRIPGGKIGDRDLSPFWIGKAEVTWGLFNAFSTVKDPRVEDTVTRPQMG